MKIEYSASDYHPYGDFTIRAENDNDRAILKNFVSAAYKGKDVNSFRLHSYGGVMGVTDMVHFGWSVGAMKWEKERKKKRRIKAFATSIIAHVLGLVIGCVLFVKRGKSNG